MKKSLQIVKNHILKKEEILKSIHNIHPDLSHLSIEEILSYFKTNNLEDLKNHIKSIRQQQVPLVKELLKPCSCVDRKGRIKDLYTSEVLAIEEKKRVKKEKNIQLSIYSCPSNQGWHLTSV
ncbi:MAG: hypothetical protein U9O24_02470 [Campylobacterota bacterium]|nr:hypothetical protein [Campylobacterota bacterium]